MAPAHPSATPAASTAAQLQADWKAARAKVAEIERSLAALEAPFAAEAPHETVGPLDGVTVLEVANWAACPAAAAIMADLGATVIKVEAAEGDSMRWALQPARVPDPQNPGRFFNPGEVIDANFNFCNRGKQSICLDIGSADGRGIVHRLSKQCDVFLTNLIPTRLRQFELTYDDIKQLNPMTVYAQLSPYGQTGPMSERTGFDYSSFFCAGGVGSVMGLMGDRAIDRAGSEWFRPGAGDLPTALAMSNAILSGLHMREKTGRGCEVETSLLRNASFVIGLDYSNAMIDGLQPPAFNPDGIGNPAGRAYLTSDDRKIVYAMPINWPQYWPRFGRMLGLPEEVIEEGLVNRRSAISAEMHEMCERLHQTKTLAEWTALATDAELTFSPVATLPEYIQNEQVAHAGSVAKLEHPLLGTIKTPNTPFGMPGTAVGARSVAPEPGADTAKIMLGMGGYSEAELLTFQEKGVVGHRPRPGTAAEASVFKIYK